MDDLNEQVSQEGVILLSELLKNNPSDETLKVLFPDPDNPNRAAITHFGLAALKLRLEGLSYAAIDEKLQTTHGKSAYWARATVFGLRHYVPDKIDVDIPSMRKRYGIKPYLVDEQYTKLSELLRDMPTDEVLAQLDRERSDIRYKNIRHLICRQDLYILQQRLMGRTYGSIGQEFGKTPEGVRQWIVQIKMGLKRDLSVELDVPGLFGVNE